MNMASSGYGYYSYHQPAMPYYYNYYTQQQARGGGGGSRPSVHLFLFLATVSLYATASLYAWCESAVESLLHQVRPLLILSPVLFIVAVQLWVASSGADRRGGGLAYVLSHLVGDHQRGAAPYGRAGAGAASSPWGVALVLVLVLVLFLVSWQSSFQDWRLPRFPLRRRR